jgi:hypothetical protein
VLSKAVIADTFSSVICHEGHTIVVESAGYIAMGQPKFKTMK